MRITCISDTHGHHHKLDIPRSNILIHSGDFTNTGKLGEVINFLDWYSVQPSDYKILICGNHEVYISYNESLLRKECERRNITYLNNEHVTVDGIKIFGSPYSVSYGNWAFMDSDVNLKNIWDKIEDDIHILITHGPAHGRLDKTIGGSYAGSQTLTDRIKQLKDLKLHVFGHIHESKGMSTIIDDLSSYTAINAAICGIPYHYLSTPLSIDLDE